MLRFAVRRATGWNALGRSCRTVPAVLCLMVLSSTGGAAKGGGAAPGIGCPDEASVKLMVTVAGTRNSKGTVAITLYGDRPEDFLAPGRKIARIRVPISNGTAEGCLAPPRPGSYAIAVYHDEDGDRDFDRTLIGLPAEGFGFSNNPATHFGLPRFEDVAFVAHPGVNRLRISLHY